MFAEIIFPIRSFRTFTNKVPQNLLPQISIGSSINTKINNRLASGYVIKLSDTCSYKGKIHNIDTIYNNYIKGNQVKSKISISYGFHAKTLFCASQSNEF